MTRMTEQIGRVLGGRYRLLAALGSGASAQVYLADDVRLRRRVAVKVLHPALADDELFLRRFRAEAQAAAALSHSHIVAVYDWSGDDITPYLVIEYLGGGSLRSILDAGHRLTPAQALIVGLETARALDHAHRQGFVHRDIKPANVLFGDDARLRVADFGLARAIAEAALTEPTGAVLGTARYASPEQARGASVDGRSDVYSLALVLVEAVTGRVPFSADTTIATLMARLDSPLPIPDEMGPLVPVLRRAGQVDPDERLDAAALGAGLVAAAERLTRPAPLPLVPPSFGNGRDDPTDHTLVGPGANDQAVVPPPAGGSASGEADAGPTDATTVLPPPARLSPSAGPPGGPNGPTGDGWRAGDTPPRGTPSLSPGDRSARRLMIGALVVAVAVAVGVAGAWIFLQSRVPSHVVPAELIGAQEGRALDLIGGNGWDIVTQRDHYDDTDEGEIVRTVPEPGTSLREGEALTLHVSLGPTPVAVPQDLAGLSREEAEARLRDLGLTADVTEQTSDEVDEGFVIGLGDDVPAEVPRGSSVEIVVSSGGDRFDLPDFIGDDYRDVIEELEDLGLEWDVDFRGRFFSDDGEVLRTDPREGDEVERGDTVELRVGGGDEDDDDD